MDAIKNLIYTLLEFARTNYVKIIVISVITFIGIVIYFATTSSLKKLKTKNFQYYPFDTFFPHSGSWSVGTFLLIILCLGLLFIFLSKGSLYPGPA
jgi:hypothetical protein